MHYELYDMLEICGSCQNYIGLCRYVQGEKEPEGHCDCSQCGTWDERRFIGKNAVSSGWLCKGDRRNDIGYCINTICNIPNLF